MNLPGLSLPGPLNSWQALVGNGVSGSTESRGVNLVACEAKSLHYLIFFIQKGVAAVG